MREKHKVTGLFERIVSWENLLASYYEARRGKRERNEVITYTSNLERNLHNLQEKLLTETYRVGRYRQFIVSIPKPRLVMALQFEDRIVQWAIYRVLNPYLERWQIVDSYGCRAGKGARPALDRLQYWLRDDWRKYGKDGGFLKLDITKFFYRVDHEIILTLFDFVDDARFIRLMSHIIDNPDVPFGLPLNETIATCPLENRLFDVGMPIGNLSSQMIANMYLNIYDQHAKHDLRIHHYIRYMDDIVILGRRDEMKRYRDDAGIFIPTRLNLQLNRKTLIGRLDDGIDFVGHTNYPTHRLIRKSTVKHMKNSLRMFAELYSRGEMCAAEIKPRYDSYLGMMRHSASKGLEKWIRNNIRFERTKV